MVIEENKEKVGFGSWYYTRSYNDEAKAQFATLKEFDEHNKKIAFDRVNKEVKQGVEARFKMVGGARPTWYKGIVLRGGFDRYNGGYIIIRQPKT
jgi:hypothetical protein